MSDKAKYLAHVVDVGDFAIIEKELLAEAGTSKQEDDDDWEDVSEEEEDARFAKDDEKLQRLIGLLKVELFGAYAELANEHDQPEEFKDPRLPTVNRKGKCIVTARGAGVKGLRAIFFKTETTRNRRVRFCEAQVHRPERMYRRSRKYWRQSSQYKPGRHADTNGEGFWNTSMYDPKLAERNKAMLG